MHTVWEETHTNTTNSSHRGCDSLFRSRLQRVEVEFPVSEGQSLFASFLRRTEAQLKTLFLGVVQGHYWKPKPLSAVNVTTFR